MHYLLLLSLTLLCTYQCIAPGTTPQSMDGDLIHMKSIPSPLGQTLISNAPIRTVYVCLLSVNIDQIPLIRGTFIGQNTIKSPLFACRGVGGAIH